MMMLLLTDSASPGVDLTETFIWQMGSNPDALGLKPDTPGSVSSSHLGATKHFNFIFASEILDLTKTVWAYSRINFGRKVAIIFQRKRSLLGKNGRFGAKNFALRRLRQLKTTLRHFVNRQMGNRNFVNQLIHQPLIRQQSVNYCLNNSSDM